MTKEYIETQIIAAGMLPVFYNHDLETSKNVVDVCYKAGVKVFEFTNRGENALVNFSKLKEHSTKNSPDMLLGIGSITSSVSALEFINLGADFIVSPIFTQEIAEVCMAHAKLFIPGCATPTEIFIAYQAGCELIKIFPASSLGSAFVSNVLGPMPWLKLMATGGIEPDNETMEKWFKAGIVCVGMGSQLLKTQLIVQNEYATLESDISTALQLVKEIKTKFNQ